MTANVVSTPYGAFKLGQDKWLLGFVTQAAQRPRLRMVPARDLERVREEIAKAKLRFAANALELARNGVPKTPFSRARSAGNHSACTPRESA
jgi:hypothetical protein